MPPNLFIQKADTREAVAEGAALISRIYRTEGYIGEHEEAASAITNYLYKSETTTFLARIDHLLYGTVSIVQDGEGGLPMDIIYKSELSPLREGGTLLGEVCQFIVDKILLKELIRDGLVHISEMDVSLGLLRETIQYGFNHSFDYFVFTINPKHRALYESLGCVQIGVEKSYPSVNAAPALAYVLDIRKLKEMASSGVGTNMLLRKIFAGVDV